MNWAPYTESFVTGSISRNAPPTSKPSAAAMSNRLRRAASIKPPAGVCIATVTRPPKVSANPTVRGFRPLNARYAARNGPSPVWTSARKKLSHPSERKLRGDGVGEPEFSAGGGGAASRCAGSYVAVCKTSKRRRSRGKYNQENLVQALYAGGKLGGCGGAGFAGNEGEAARLCVLG